MTLRQPYITPAKKPQQWATPDGTRQTNINQFTNPIPFSQTDWPRVHAVILYVSDVPHTDINNYPNPIPVNNSAELLLVPVEPIPSVKGRDYLQNIGLYTNPIPFKQTDWSNPFRSPDFLPSGTVPANINLLAPVVSNPFYTQDFSTTRLVPDWLPNYAPQAYNINLYTNPIPFSTQDFAKNSVNPDWAPVLIYSNLVLQQPVVGNPFYGQDFSVNHVIPDYLPGPTYPNLVLLNFSTPFFTRDFSKPFVPVISKTDPQSVNVRLFTNPIPNNQYDWTKLWSVKPIASDQNTLPNIALFNPTKPSTALGLFGWTDWSYTKSPVIIVPDQSNLPNIVLIVTPPPPPPPDDVASGRYPSRWQQGYEERVKGQTNQTDLVKQAAAVISKLGGHARAAAMTAKERSNSASHAANVRWKK